MKALSLLQPYASLIALGYKRYETRSWSTTYRGPLLIHASAGKPKWAREVCKYDPIIRQLLARHGLTFDTLPRGVLLSSCELLEVSRILHRRGSEWGQEPQALSPAELSDTELACGDYTPGRFAWQLAQVHLLANPRPAKGALGLWDPSTYLFSPTP